MRQPNFHPVDLMATLKPETPLERRLLADPAFSEGLFWGVPRFGHPEGEIYKHIREVLDNIEKLEISDQDRRDLRIITFAHDTFKFLEDKREPRDWSKHHGALARKYMENHLDSSSVLDIIELHDEAYYIWREALTNRRPENAKPRLKHLLDTMGQNLQLYYLFFVCDTLTGDKIHAPLNWFEQIIPEIQIPALRQPAALK